MNLTLSLSEQESAELERRADAAGTDVKTYLLRMLRDLDDLDESLVYDPPYDQWKREFQQWIDGHRSRNKNMDDSRESIYE
ncbi:hypothetical protein SH449x_001607 [Pirellulaceae bacterium SH449]